MRRLWQFAGIFLRSERGAVAVIVTLLLPVLIGFMAIGGEVGSWFLKQRELQHYADLAAHAAAGQLAQGVPATLAEQAARGILADVGFSDVTEIVIPPATGPHAGVAGYAEVRLRTSLARYFSALFSQGLVEIDARAVAGASGGYPACMLALSHAAPGAITVSGSSVVQLDGCSFVSNSVAADSFLMQGGGSVTVTAGCVSVAGEVVVTSALTLTDCDAPQTLQPAVPDPYASRIEPTVTGTCAPIGKTISNASLSPTEMHPIGLPLMRICGGISISGTVAFASGLYIIDGGTFTANANSLVRGNGVAFFLVNGARLKLNGTSTLFLSAMANGPLAGLLFFTSRTAPAVQHSFLGTADSKLNGALYFPTGDLAYQGNFVSTDTCLQIVSERIEITGNSNLKLSCTPVGGQEILSDRNPRLVE